MESLGSLQWYGLFTHEGRMIAFCMIGTINPHAVFLYNVAVVPEQRHRGVGTQLMNQLLSHFPHQIVYLFVNKTNHPAFQLYRHFGFTTTTTSYVPPPGEICMERHGTSSDLI